MYVALLVGTIVPVKRFCSALISPVSLSIIPRFSLQTVRLT